ncbi:MAG: hypothetical protein ACLFUH_03340 [Bacteroidales bacterium]
MKVIPRPKIRCLSCGTLSSFAKWKTHCSNKQWIDGLKEGFEKGFPNKTFFLRCPQCNGSQEYTAKDFFERNHGLIKVYKRWCD